MLTALDQIANKNHLQMIKAAIPYIQPNSQKFISMFVKLLELQNIISFYDQSHDFIHTCSSDSPPSSITDILSDIRNYCDDNEQSMIDQMLQFFSALELYSMFSQASPECFGQEQP